jgi:hypothetical protein
LKFIKKDFLGTFKTRGGGKWVPRYSRKSCNVSIKYGNKMILQKPPTTTFQYKLYAGRKTEQFRSVRIFLLVMFVQWNVQSAPLYVFAVSAVVAERIFVRRAGRVMARNRPPYNTYHYIHLSRRPPRNNDKW